MCPNTICMCSHTTMCPHTTIYVRILLHEYAYCYICVRMQLYVSAYYYICVLIPGLGAGGPESLRYQYVYSCTSKASKLSTWAWCARTRRPWDSGGLSAAVGWWRVSTCTFVPVKQVNWDSGGLSAGVEWWGVSTCTFVLVKHVCTSKASKLKLRF